MYKQHLLLKQTDDTDKTTTQTDEKRNQDDAN